MGRGGHEADRAAQGARRLVAAAALVCALAARAEDPAAAAAQAAAAHEAGDAGALAALAAQNEPDPWLVADELRAGGRTAAALAFALAAPRRDVARLPEYLERGPPPDRALRGLLDEAGRALRGRTLPRAWNLLKGAEAPGAGLGAVRLRHLRGEVLQALRRHADAATEYGAAAELAEGVGWYRRAAAALDLAAASAYEAEEYDRALTLYERLLARQEQRRDRKGVARALTGIGTVHHVSRRLETALGFYERALAVVKELEDEASVARILENIGLLHYWARRLGAAIDYLERARALHEKRDDAVAARETLRTLGRAHELKGQAHAERREPDAARAAFRAAASVAARTGDAPDLFRRLERLRGAAPAANTLAAVRVHLRAHEALVLYARLDEQAWAVVVRRDGVRIAGPATSCDVTFQPGADPAPYRAALVAPLELPPAVKRVLVAPGEYARLPFALLWAGREAACVPSGTGLIALEPGGGRGKAVLVADDGTAFRAALRQRERWRAIHLTRPEFAGELGSASTDLVVASRCRSAGEAVALASRLLEAGVPRVLVNLWPVDEAANRAFVAKYLELWETQAAAKALAQAQELLRAQERWSDPRHWAAWQLWGAAD